MASRYFCSAAAQSRRSASTRPSLNRAGALAPAPSGSRSGGSSTAVAVCAIASQTSPSTSYRIARDGSIWPVNLARLGEESVQRFGEYAALHFEGRELTNVDQQRAGACVANALVRMGVQPGDRVVVLMPNCPEVLAAYTGILKTGAVIVPIVFLLSADEVRHILADSGAKVVITAPELAAKVDGWRGPVITVGGANGGARAWDEWIAREPDAFVTIERADGDLA